MMVKSGDILWREDDEPNTCWIVENADEKFFVAAKYRPRDEKSLERISISRGRDQPRRCRTPAGAGVS